MKQLSFNLITDPWIKVIDKNNNLQKVSLSTLFKNSQDYKQLAGEMKSQDLAVFRFLLAILTTVYSRFDASGKPYDGLQLDDKFQVIPEDPDDVEDEVDGADPSLGSSSFDETQALLKTWADLYHIGHFSSIVVEYLEKYKEKFDMFGDTPFYQVTAEIYDSLVPEKKKISTGSGTTAVKQINRTISESAHTPNIFAPRSDSFKNRIKIDELVRWIITYQNFTGVTDKTKVNANEKFSVSAGWLYGLNPVFAQGDNLFETLILNLTFFDKDEDLKLVPIQRPIWEWEKFSDYISYRLKAELPDNISEMYTMWSRVLHIEWNGNAPTIFSAGLPKVSSENAFIEPMTTWKTDKKELVYKPNTKWIKTVGESMWRNFGQYTRLSESNEQEKKTIHQPGIVTWLNLLENRKLLPANKFINLATVGLISDGNATSQSPAVEVWDEMKIKADVLFDSNEKVAIHWPVVIEDEIDLTKKVVNYYWSLVNNVGKLRELSDPNSFANNYSTELYNQLNNPFLNWLSSLKNTDDRNKQAFIWRTTLKQIVLNEAENFVHSASPRDIKGIIDKDKKTKNIFTEYKKFTILVLSKLKKG